MKQCTKKIKRTPEDNKKRKLKHLYNISVTQFESLKEKQNNLCAICDSYQITRNSTNYRELCIDHDHSCCPLGKSCGKCIRGLLCDKCNRGIGNFNDDINLLISAITYLQNNNSLKGEK